MLTKDDPQIYCDTRLGGIPRWLMCQWEDISMRIPDELLSCVCFLCINDDGVYRYGGTGFFVSVPSEKHTGNHYPYLVTAKHCIEKVKQYGDVYVRLNKRNGGTEFIPIENSAQWFYSEYADVALLKWVCPQNVFQYNPISNDLFLTDELIKGKGIGVGDEIFMTGLFTKHYGNQQNIPIVRSGIISAMPYEPLEDQESGIEYYAYLAEVRSIGGLSGSPVYVALHPARVHQKSAYQNWSIHLLGLVRGHWDIKRSGLPLDFADDELQAVNMGIAIITPIQYVAEILNGKEHVKMRRNADKEISKTMAPVDDAGGDYT